MSEPLLSSALLAPGFLFRFSIPCLRTKLVWQPTGIALGEEYRVPSFGALEQRPQFADVRLGWNETGLFFGLRVSGKRQTPWCREGRPEDSDGLVLLVDTRDTHNIHRASRFCHQFIFMPTGAGRRSLEALALPTPINRARENPKPTPISMLGAVSEVRIDGYVLSGFIPAKALTGFDPTEHPKLGFSYAVIDRELGWQVFSLGPEFPVREDPSLWGTLELVDGETAVAAG